MCDSPEFLSIFSRKSCGGILRRRGLCWNTIGCLETGMISYACILCHVMCINVTQQHASCTRTVKLH